MLQWILRIHRFFLPRNPSDPTFYTTGSLGSCADPYDPLFFSTGFVGSTIFLLQDPSDPLFFSNGIFRIHQFFPWDHYDPLFCSNGIHRIHSFFFVTGFFGSNIFQRVFSIHHFFCHGILRIHFCFQWDP